MSYGVLGPALQGPGITVGPNGLTLAPATAGVIGGIKAGAGVTVAADGTLSLGPAVWPIRKVTASATISAATDYTVLCTGTGITITLPTAPATGAVFVVKNGNTTGAVTVSAPVNIDASTSATVAAGAALRVQYDGSQWRTI